MIHISKFTLRQSDKEYLQEMNRKRDKQPRSDFQKILDAEIAKLKNKADN